MTIYKKRRSEPTRVLSEWEKQLTFENVKQLLQMFVNTHPVESFLWKQSEKDGMNTDEMYSLLTFVTDELFEKDYETYWPLIIVLDAPYDYHEDVYDVVPFGDDDYECKNTADALSGQYDWVTIFRDMAPSDVKAADVAAWIVKHNIVPRGDDPYDSEDGDLYLNQGLITYLAHEFPRLVDQQVNTLQSDTPRCNRQCRDCEFPTC